jgi:hypothetical protein
MVYRCNNGSLTKIALVLGSLGGQNVTGESMTSFDLARAGFLETLGRSPVCLDFRHLSYLPWD